MKKTRIAILIAVLLISGISAAEIVNPDPVSEGDVVYSVRDHNVTATHKTTNALIWNTYIAMDDYKGPYDRNLPEEAQLNTIVSIRIAGDLLKVTNGKKEVIWLDKKTGHQKPLNPHEAHPKNQKSRR